MAAHFGIVKGDNGDENARDKLSAMFGPGHVDQMIRSAIQACWMAMPKERQNVVEIEKEIRRLVERALKDLREDAAAYERST